MFSFYKAITAGARFIKQVVDDSSRQQIQMHQDIVRVSVDASVQPIRTSKAAPRLIARISATKSALSQPTIASLDIALTPASISLTEKKALVLLQVDDLIPAEIESEIESEAETAACQESKHNVATSQDQVISNDDCHIAECSKEEDNAVSSPGLPAATTSTPTKSWAQLDDEDDFTNFDEDFAAWASSTTEKGQEVADDEEEENDSKFIDMAIYRNQSLPGYKKVFPSALSVQDYRNSQHLRYLLGTMAGSIHKYGYCGEAFYEHLQGLARYDIKIKQ